MNDKLILVINPGSTSTKIAVFRGNENILSKNLGHSPEELSAFPDMAGQYGFRKNAVLEELKNNGIDISGIGVVMGRGGWLKPVKSGVYRVTEALKERLRLGIKTTQHASNLGGLIADDIARGLPDAGAYIADPPVVDEMDEVARITGHPAFERKALFHALNQKAVARKHAGIAGKPYEELNLIVAHMGGGISIGAHRKGRIVDVNNCLDGEGPFTPERSGTLPAGDLVKLCFSGKHTQEEIRKMLTGRGGCVAYLGTTDNRELESRAAAGDRKAALIEDAMAYQVAKDIGAMFTVLSGEVDGILLTGGLAFNRRFIELITRRVARLADVHVYPGEGEMEALAQNGLRVLNGEAEVLEYDDQER